jgi:PHD/YefM family antitoxin component YafN of YafNO toxin-antitoxin module
MTPAECRRPDYCGIPRKVVKYGCKENSMPVIRPLADLETSPKEIIQAAHESREPVFLTSHGYGDLVVVSMDAWEDKKFGDYVYRQLKEASEEADSGPRWLTHEEVFGPIRQEIEGYKAAVKDA